jgi:hypothetical protein
MLHEGSWTTLSVNWMDSDGRCYGRGDWKRKDGHVERLERLDTCAVVNPAGRTIVTVVPYHRTEVYLYSNLVLFYPVSLADMSG